MELKGSGQRYRCNKCDFDLHPNCMFPSDTITIQGQRCHFYHKPPQELNCRKANSKCRNCDACGMPIKGFVYHCPSTDWDFHPTCANLETEIIIDDVNFSLQNQGPSNCAWCKRKLVKGAVKKIPGWSYVAEDEDYNLHVYCVMEMVMQVKNSATKTNEGHTGADGSLSLASKGAKELSLKNKPNKVSKTIKWFKILKIFLGTVFSILLGDPTTFFATSMAHLVVEVLSNAAGS